MKYKIAFVCIGNSCRSQMAEGFAKNKYNNIFESYSAGTNPSKNVDSNAIEVMKEKGIDITNQYPKYLKDIPDKLDILITMGCGVSCPVIPTKHKEDWGLEDPKGKPIGKFKTTRDIIESKLDEIVEKLENNNL